MGKATAWLLEEGYLRLLDDFGVFPKYVPQEKPKDKRVNGKIVVDGLVIKVWYSLGDFLYGNLITNTVVRVDKSGVIAIPGRQTDIHFEYGKSEGTAPLNWRIPTDQRKWLKDTHVHSGVKMWKRTSNKMESSRPYMVKMDGVEMLQHGTERSLDSWINNYRKVFVQQPFRITKEIITEKEEVKKEKKSYKKATTELFKGMSVEETEKLIEELTKLSKEMK